MLFSKLCNLRRWGALTCILAFSVALAACGDDDDATNNTRNSPAADAGSDVDDQDTGDQDTGEQDAGTDAFLDTGADEDTGEQDTGDQDTGEQDAGTETIEVEGTYTTQFDSTETISETMWNDNPIDDFDNTENWAVTYTPDDAAYNPDTYSKLVWTEPDGQGAFFYCIVDYGLETAEAARSTSETADDTDPANGGCSGFSWTQMTPE